MNTILALTKTKQRKILKIGVDVEELVVYIVLEDDPQVGTIVAGVFVSRDDADKAYEENPSNRWLVKEVVR